jgi:hypothetical protein
MISFFMIEQATGSASLGDADSGRAAAYIAGGGVHLISSSEAPDPSE